MRILLITLFSLGLIACDGLDIDSIDNSSSSTDQQFTRSELAFNVLFSSLLLSDTGLSGSRDGFIVLFKTSSTLEQIKLRANNDDNALVGEYAWTIDDEKLQVSYPDGITCTSTKTTETGSQSTATASCDGGEPNNDQIRNTLFKLNTLDADAIASRTVTIDNADNDRKIDFFSNNTFEVVTLNTSGDELASTRQAGTYDKSDVYDKVIKLENPVAGEVTLFLLLEGSLASGTMLELRYTSATETTSETLKEVIIYKINADNKWHAESLYNDIDVDS